MASERLESERRLMATDRAQRSDSGVDHRDPDAHRAAIMDRGSQALKAPRKVQHPSLAGTVRVIGDK